MHWFLENWQTIAALGIVALTVAIFALRLARPKKSPGCGTGCGCGAGKDAARTLAKRE